MPNFNYTAKTADGATVKGALEAASKAVVLDALHRQGLVVVQVKTGKAVRVKHTGSVKMDDLAIFSRQLATLVDAGIPIVGGLDAVGDQLENPTLKAVVLKIRDSVEEGTNFTAAIAQQSQVFSPLFVGMVRAGEASGHLAEVLDRLATYLEKSAALQRKVKAACIYPALVISMAVVVITALMIKVIPTFKDIFDQLGAKLPLPTQILITVSELFQRGFLPGLCTLVVGTYAVRRYSATPNGRLFFDRMMLKLGLIGVIVRKVAIAKFSRTLSTLVKSGVPILNALEIVAETSGNRVVGDAILHVRSSIKEGENISEPLTASRVFPPMVVRMIAVGEQTGRLDEMLTRVADFYDDQVDTAVSGLTSALEPIIIAVLGVVVGGIVMSIFLPIFQMTEHLSG